MGFAASSQAAVLGWNLEHPLQLPTVLIQLLAQDFTWDETCIPLLYFWTESSLAEKGLGVLGDRGALT